MGKIKKEFILNNLNCAHCAGRIEKDINLLEEIDEARLDFVSKRLIIYGEENKLLNIDKFIKKIVSSTEPDVKVFEKDQLDNNKDEEFFNEKFFRFSFGAVLFLVAALIKFSGYINFLFYVLTYIIIGYDVLIKCVRSIYRGNIFNENFLMGIATIGAFIIGEYPEGVAVMFFYQAGEMFQDMSISNSRKSIKSLLNIKAEYANLVIGGNIKKVTPQEVDINDIILIKPGERVPLDGFVVEGESSVDTSAITGESFLKSIKKKQEILSGYINISGVIKVRASKNYENSTVSKIMDLVENASIKKAKTEKFITKFAKIYTPTIVVISIIIATFPTFILGYNVHTWIYRALAFLVVSCPCALVISIPLGFFGGIGAASKNGILIKGSNYLEALNSIDSIIFDKTGTLTEGNFRVIKVKSLNGFSEDEVLEIAACGEIYSNHLIAKSILKAYHEEVNKKSIKDFKEISGFGVITKYKDNLLLIGNDKLMKKYNIKYKLCEEPGTKVYVALNNKLIGIIVINDELKKDSKKTIIGLENLGISNIIMLSGDTAIAAEAVGNELGIKNVYSGLSPEDKVNILENIMSKKNKNVIFVGDGINDGPVLSRADIGISMGALGSDVAIEASDIVLMVDEPSKIIVAIKIARFTRKIIIENIFFALGIKLLVLVLVLCGFSTMWEAVFADVGVALLAIFNSMRASKLNYG